MANCGSDSTARQTVDTKHHSTIMVFFDRPNHDKIKLKKNNTIMQHMIPAIKKDRNRNETQESKWDKSKWLLFK